MKNKWIIVLVGFSIFVKLDNSVAQQKIIQNVAVGGQFGLVLPDDAFATNVETTVGFGLLIQATIKEIIPKLPLVLSPNINYWNSNFESRGNNFGDVWELSFGLNILSEIPLSLNLPFEPFVGGGLGAYIRKVDVGIVDDTDFNLGVNLLGGAKYPLSSQIDLFGEINLKFGGTTTFRIMIGGLFNVPI